MIEWATIVAAWDSFWFTTESSSPWTIFRILIGLMAAGQGWMIVRNRFELYWTGPGCLGLRNGADYHTIPPWPRFCLYDHLPHSKHTVTFLTYAWFLLSLCIMVGYYTGPACFLWFLVSTSHIHRNIMCNHSGDSYLRLLVFVIGMASVLTPEANSMLSLDKYLATGDLGLDTVWAPWPLRIVMIMWATVYLYASIHKLKGTWWRNGTAGYYPLYCSGYRRMFVPSFLLRPFWIKLGTWGTMVTEASGPLAFVKPIMPFIVINIVVLHLIMDWALNIQLFGFIMIAACAVWITPDVADGILQNVTTWFAVGGPEVVTTAMNSIHLSKSS